MATREHAKSKPIVAYATVMKSDPKPIDVYVTVMKSDPIPTSVVANVLENRTRKKKRKQ